MPFEIDSELEDLKRRHPGAPLSILLLDSCYTGHEDTFDPLEDEELPQGKRLPPREGWVTRQAVVELLGISSSKFRYMENAGYLPRARQIRNHVKMYDELQVSVCYLIWQSHKIAGHAPHIMWQSTQQFIEATNPGIFS